MQPMGATGQCVLSRQGARGWENASPRKPFLSPSSKGAVTAPGTSVATNSAEEVLSLPCTGPKGKASGSQGGLGKERRLQWANTTVPELWEGPEDRASLPVEKAPPGKAGPWRLSQAQRQPGRAWEEEAPGLYPSGGLAA